MGTKGKPTAILAKTFKGFKFPNISDKDNWHGKPLGDKAEAVIESIRAQMESQTAAVNIVAPVEDAPSVDITNIRMSSPPAYKKGDLIATRVAYGTVLQKLAEGNSRVIGLDGDTKNSTYSEKIKNVSPDRYIECFIAEQNLVSIAIGVGCRGRTVPFVSTFAAFFTRAFDQLRMGAISQTNINCVGSHAGISIGEDGPSQIASSHGCPLREQSRLYHRQGQFGSESCRRCHVDCRCRNYPARGIESCPRSGCCRHQCSRYGSLHSEAHRSGNADSRSCSLSRTCPHGGRSLSRRRIGRSCDIRTG